MPMSFSDIFRRLMRAPGPKIGLIILVVMILVAVLAPWIAPYEPLKLDVKSRFEPPSSEHWMGTDSFGRDVLTRVMYGSRISLVVGLISVGIGTTVGTTVGLVSGFIGGTVDTVIMRLIDVMLALPTILLAMVLIVSLGQSLTNVMVAIGLSSVPAYARLTRGNTMAIRERTFVEAAVASGMSRLRIMVKHVFPNVIAPIIVVATLSTASAIIFGSALSFLGMGAQPPTPEWGLLLSEGRSYLGQAWWVSTFPGLAIVATVLGINLLGDGLRDVLDPKLRQ